MKKEILGALLVSAVASWAAAEGVARADDAAAPAAPAKAAHFCQNNSCKGHSACKGHGNDSCKQQNSCKGHGFLEAASGKACKKAGGKWKKDTAPAT